MIERNTLLKLEYDKLLSQISDYAHSNCCKKLICDIVPAENYDQAKLRLAMTEEAVNLITRYNIKPSFNMEDIKDIVSIATKGVMLSIEELYSVWMFCSLIDRIIKEIRLVDGEKTKSLSFIINRISEFDRLEELLSGSIKNSNELLDTASVELARLRKCIIKTKGKINAKLNSYINNSTYNKYLQDNIISVRDNRYVIPLKVEFNGKIKGIMHDQSSSGQTLFIEPLDVLELNNELRGYEISEQLEISRILSNLSSTVAANAKDLIESFENALYLESVFAIADYSASRKYTCPKINVRGLINIKRGKHPLLNTSVAVPNDVLIGDKYGILMISGANAGGKTVCMKMTGLIVLMAMSGIFVPADELSDVSYFEKIYCDIGDMQSIEDSLSTFSSHITNLKHITQNVDEKSLILLDELGGGTDPTEGSALAIAICEYLVNKRVKGIITTHFNNIKIYSSSSDYIKNASLEYDYEQMKPTYKLLMGIAGTSNALKIATQYGLDKGIIDKAYSLVSVENIKYEEALREAENKSRELNELIEKNRCNSMLLDNKLIEAIRKNDELDSKLTKINENGKIMAKKIVESYTDEAEEIIAELKALLKAPDESDVITANKLKKKLNNLAPIIDEDNSLKYDIIDEKPIVGDMVFSKKLNDIAKLVSIKGNKVELSLNGMQIYEKIENLKKARVINSGKSTKKKVIYKDTVELKTDAISNEINIIGKTCEEAMPLVSTFLDKAINSGLSELRIVHGKGTFTLKKAVWNLLKTRKDIISYRSGIYGEGELGVTIVRIKE